MSEYPDFDNLLNNADIDGLAQNITVETDKSAHIAAEILSNKRKKHNK